VAKPFPVACCLITWGDEQKQNLEKCLREIKAAGYDGVESLIADSVEEVLEQAALAARCGLKVLNIYATEMFAPEAQRQFIRRSAALGLDRVEIWDAGRAHYRDNPTEADFVRCARDLESLADYAVSHGLRPYCHTHVGCMLETKEDVGLLMRHAPRLWLLVDTGHLLVCGSDPVAVVRDHGPRVAHVHLRDFYAEPGWSRQQPEPWSNAHDALLGKGNRGFSVPEFLWRLERVGYDGWISVEQGSQPGLSAGEMAWVERRYLESIGY